MKIIEIKRYMIQDSERKEILRNLKNKNMSMSQLSKELDISKAYLSDILAGNRYLIERIQAKLKDLGILG